MVSERHDLYLSTRTGDANLQPSAVLDAYLELAFLAEQRRVALSQPAFTLAEQSALDWRIDSVLDGLRISGRDGYDRLMQALATPTAELVFVATVLTLENRNTARLKLLLALAEAEPAWQTPVLDAFAWVPASFTQPLAPHLLATASSFCRRAALHLYRTHQVHADTVLEWAMTQPDPSQQQLALHAAGETGVMDLLPRLPGCSARQ